jgi:hypothetical protein
VWPCSYPFRYVIIPLEVNHISDPSDGAGSRRLIPFRLIAFEHIFRPLRIDECTFPCAGLSSISLPTGFEVLEESWFFCFESLLLLTFGWGSTLSRIDARALYHCSTIKWIYLRVSVEFLWARYFSGCHSPSSFTFESESNLHSLNQMQFELLIIKINFSSCLTANDRWFGSHRGRNFDDDGWRCQSLFPSFRCFSAWHWSNLSYSIFWLWFTNSIQLPYRNLMSWMCLIVHVNLIIDLWLEEGCQLTLIDTRALSRCSTLQAICIPEFIEILRDGCFDCCNLLSSLIFESKSKLSRILAHTFRTCSSLQLICIAASA